MAQDLETLIRLPAVRAATGLSRSSIYALMKCGAFPSPVALSVRAVAWRRSDITQFIQSRRLKKASVTQHQDVGNKYA